MEYTIKNCDFTMLDNEIIRDYNKFDKNEILAYMALSFFANKEKKCSPSYGTLAKIMRTSRTTAIQAVQKLVEKGVIKLKNRKSKEDKKEMTSNEYVVNTKTDWEESKDENRKYIVEKKMEYTRRTTKGKITKEINKLKKDKKNTSDLENTNQKSDALNNLTVNTIIPQNLEESKENTEISKTAKMLKDAGIVYVPYKKEKELVDTLEEGVLRQAIDNMLMVGKNSWYDVLGEFDRITIQRNREREQLYEMKKSSTNIYNQTKSIGELEFERFILEKKHGKRAY